MFIFALLLIGVVSAQNCAVNNILVEPAYPAPYDLIFEANKLVYQIRQPWYQDSVNIIIQVLPCKPMNLTINKVYNLQTTNVSLVQNFYKTNIVSNQNTSVGLYTFLFIKDSTSTPRLGMIFVTIYNGTNVTKLNVTGFSKGILNYQMSISKSFDFLEVSAIADQSSTIDLIVYSGQVFNGIMALSSRVIAYSQYGTTLEQKIQYNISYVLV